MNGNCLLPLQVKAGPLRLNRVGISQTSHAVLLGMLVAVTGCSAGDDTGLRLARELEKQHPGLIERVVYQPPNFLDPPHLRVFLRASVTRQQAAALICHSVVPALEARAPRIGLSETRVKAYGKGEEPMAEHCWR